MTEIFASGFFFQFFLWFQSKDAKKLFVRLTSSFYRAQQQEFWCGDLASNRKVLFPQLSIFVFHEKQESKNKILTWFAEDKIYKHFENCIGNASTNFCPILVKKRVCLQPEMLVKAK